MAGKREDYRSFLHYFTGVARDGVTALPSNLHDFMFVLPYYLLFHLHFEKPISDNNFEPKHWQLFEYISSLYMLSGKQSSRVLYNPRKLKCKQKIWFP